MMMMLQHFEKISFSDYVFDAKTDYIFVTPSKHVASRIMSNDL